MAADPTFLIWQVVRDMHGACGEICKLAGLEPMATHEAPAV